MDGAIHGEVRLKNSSADSLHALCAAKGYAKCRFDDLVKVGWIGRCRRLRCDVVDVRWAMKDDQKRPKKQWPSRASDGRCPSEQASGYCECAGLRPVRVALLCNLGLPLRHDDTDGCGRSEGLRSELSDGRRYRVDTI